MQAANSDIMKSRKHNQSSIQIAANHILENGGRPSLTNQSDVYGGTGKSHYHSMINSGVSSQQQQYLQTDIDNLSQSADDPGIIVVDKGTDEFKQEMKKGNNNIMVAVRCRPLSIKEKQKQSQKSVRILDEKVIILSDISAAKPEEAFRKERPKDKTYAFDYAFDEDRDQQYIFDRTTKFLIEGIMQGYNASVFAYGATGAGKTYTMLGTEDSPGIMMLSIDELFRSIDYYQQERDYKLKVSYVEVYNENIRDLLSPVSQDSNEYLDLREDQVKGVCVSGVTEIMTTNVDEINKYIRQGNRQRTKERTDANETSSRSHAVLQITVEHKDKAHGISAEINIAKLSLIDLAGSERASNTNNRGMRLLEGANINRSLLALGNCINALCELTNKSNNSNNPNLLIKAHIPYRDSKLTRLLKDSLGGNCRTVMVTNISPAFSAYEDTLNTLKYADRAKQIKTIVKRNVLNVEYHISNYTKIINQLRDEITSLRTQLAQNANQPMVQQKLQSQPQLYNYQQASNNKGKEAQNKLKGMKIEMNLQFEKEIMVKKDIYELDMKNEDLAFKLFSKQMQLTKSKAKGNNQGIEQEVSKLKQEIQQNDTQRQSLTKQLHDLEQHRTHMLGTYQQEMLQYDIDPIDILYNQHLLNIKQIDLKRKENRAEFHIKQRDNYIQHLKEQLAIRDRIIKERLGLSVTNFMPGGANGTALNGIDSNGLEILSLQDIDRISNDLIIPSLNMTKSSSFVPHFHSEIIQPHDNPYQFIGHAQPNELTPNSLSNISPQNHQRNNAAYGVSGVGHIQNLNKYRSVDPVKRDVVAKQSYAIPKKQLTGQSNQNLDASKQRIQKPTKVQDNILHYESDTNSTSHQNNNLSFQSHRNSSNSRLTNNNQNYHLQPQSLQQAPGTSGGPNDRHLAPQKSSFVHQMQQRQRQKYTLMPNNKIQAAAALGSGIGQGIANLQSNGMQRNSSNINQKLSLLKKRGNTHESSDNLDTSSTINNPHTTSFQSTRNHQQRVGGSNLVLQSNGTQIAQGTNKPPRVIGGGIAQLEVPNNYSNSLISNQSIQSTSSGGGGHRASVNQSLQQMMTGTQDNL